MKFLPRNTLAAYEAAAQKTRLDLSSRPLHLMAAVTKKYRVDCGTVNPDLRALEFYALNHYYSMVSARFTRNEILPEWALKFCQGYEAVLIEQGYRLMHYIICIIAREARHTYQPSETLMGKLKVIGGEEMPKFLTLIRNSGEDAAVKSYMDKPPELPVGPYVRGLECVFDNGKWGGGYGGKPWGQIARTLGDFVYGKTSLEMMCDTAYTLAHNNGPMFNKGMMYDMYGSKEGFLMILDVQASGQIPELIVDRAKYPYLKHMDMEGLIEYTELARKHMPDEFDAEVDWQMVEDCQAHKPLNQQHKYPQYKSKMLKKVVEPDPVFTAQPAKAVIAKSSSVDMFQGKQMAHTNQQFTVVPGEYVDIYERVAA